MHLECAGQSELMLKPKTTEDVSAILKYCNERKLAICPQSGNTGKNKLINPILQLIIVSYINKIFKSIVNSNVSNRNGRR